MKPMVYSVLALMLAVTACQKDDETTSSTYVISKDSTYNGNANQTMVRLYEYNSSKKLIRVQYKIGTSSTYEAHDTIYYDGNGRVSKVETYVNGTIEAWTVAVYSYTSGLLSSVYEVGRNDNGAYSLTRTFTYSGGKLSTLSTAYAIGSSPNGPPDNFTEVTFTGNNITSVNQTGQGVITATYDVTASNPYYGLNYKTDYFINLFSQNNILKAYLVSNPTKVFVDNAYTYIDGRVSTVTDSAQDPAVTTKITYKPL